MRLRINLDFHNHTDCVSSKSSADGFKGKVSEDSPSLAGASHVCHGEKIQLNCESMENNKELCLVSAPNDVIHYQGFNE